MAQVSTIPDEIALFLANNSLNTEELPDVINLAFSGERKPEAWHIRVATKQVIRGFNKVAPVTVMLPLVTWRKLLKKKDLGLWNQAVKDGYIHIHGDKTAAVAVGNIFKTNGKTEAVELK
ncbi:MAG: hypothetical protein DWQ05_09110 [Calditrichaeota bacterium]|nr:MAG: hypothetical protein DWQ05_09110 [Calditrichota bacterium]